MFTTSADKADDARDLGADEVVVTTDAEQMATQSNRFDLILDTASAPHDLSPHLRAVALDGTLCSLGMVGSLAFDPLSLLIGRKSLASAGSGGIRGTQKMLDFCGAHGITATVEVRPARKSTQCWTGYAEAPFATGSCWTWTRCVRHRMWQSCPRDYRASRHHGHPGRVRTNRLSVDTPRWYEREGVIPPAEPTPDGRRRYTPSLMRFVRLIRALRRTGMSVAGSGSRRVLLVVKV